MHHALLVTLAENLPQLETFESVERQIISVMGVRFCGLFAALKFSTEVDIFCDFAIRLRP